MTHFGVAEWEVQLVPPQAADGCSITSAGVSDTLYNTL
jgi:hypothetical protein